MGRLIVGHEVAPFLALYEKGLYLQAYQQATAALGPLVEWEGPDGCIFAGRLARNLGGDRLGRRMFWRAWRCNPAHPAARVYALSAARDRFGLLRAMELAEEWGELPATDPDSRHYFFCQRASMAAELRDFDSAESWVRQAEAVLKSPWTCVERASILERQDRCEEALEAAREAFRLNPWYRPAVQQAAHLLQSLNRDEEALALLAEAMEHIESFAVAAQRAVLLDELKRHAEVEPVLGEYERLSPLREKGDERWLAMRRADARYFLGDLTGAAKSLRLVDDEYFRGVADRLEAPDCAPRRVELPVAFVRQHWKTCAPATLAALGRFWGKAVDHLALAEDICYDGTPTWRERHWAETNGWMVREFRVTWDAAVQLLDRGVPFAVSTAATTSAHRQAVIGYDAVRRTLLIRDPSSHYSRETVAEPFLKAQEFSGPEGLAIVPAEKSRLLEGLDLPEAGLYDETHRVHEALGRHARDEAQAAVERLEAAAPGHRLALDARRALAGYDGNTQQLLAWTERLLALFPRAGQLRLTRLSLLREFARRQDRLEALRAICAEKDSEPVFWQELAQVLRTDAQNLDEARRWSRKALRRAPWEAAAWKTAADIAWDRREWGAATEFYRRAACLDVNNEGLARSYFLASRFLRRTEEALRFLRRRFQRFSPKAPEPAMTLFDMLAVVDRDTEAFQALDRALARRPDDGALHLFAADACMRYGRREDAAAHLETARGCSRPVDWLQKAAGVRQLQGDAPAALACWREVLELAPLHLGAANAAARLIGAIDGPAAARDFLAERCARFPHNAALHQMLVEWLWYDGASAVEPVLRRMLENDADDAWAWRELASVLREEGRTAEALEAAGCSLRLEPQLCVSHYFYGLMLAGAERHAEARKAYREALRLSADHEQAMLALLNACHTAQEKKDELAFIESELARQVLLGDGILAFRRTARGILGNDVLLKKLQTALAERPDLWHAWSAVAQQQVAMQLLNDALETARQATGRFPLLPAPHLELANIQRLRGKHDEAIRALEQALLLNPNFVPAVEMLADMHEAKGDLAGARGILEAACRRMPLTSSHHGCLAWILWRQEEKDAAVGRLRRALELDPGYDWAWDRLLEWGTGLGKPELAPEMARELARKRGGESRVWLRLAGMLFGAKETAGEFNAALDKALALCPRSEEAHQLRARALVREGRTEEALAACRPAAYGGRIPPGLLLREAWIEADRGDLHKAVARVRRLLEDSPDFYDGWRFFADWSDRLGQHNDTRAAAMKMVQLAPYNAVPHGFLADVERVHGNLTVAKEEFRRALELDPEYIFAALQLFDIVMSAGDLDGAGTLVREMVRRGMGGAHAKLCEVRLAVRRKEMETACDGLAALCRMPLENAWPLVTATNALTGRVRTRKLEEILWAAAAAPDASPFIGDALAVLWKKRSGLGKLSQAKRLIRHETVGRRAVLALVDELAEQQKKTASARPIGHRLQIWLLLRRHGGWLRRDPEGWGRVGHLFSINDDARRMLRWFNGWESRPKVEPWMLNNLVAVLLNNGRWDDALKVCRGLVHLPCRDHTTKDSQLLLAVDDLSRGDAATAERRMEGLEEKHFGEFYKLVYRCYAALRDVHWILNASELDPAKRKTALKKRVQTWKDSLPGNSSWGTAHRCVFRKTSRHLAQATGIKTFNTFLPSMRAALTPVQIALCFFVLLSLVAFAIGLFSWFTAPPPAPPPQTVPTTHTPRRFSPFEPKMQQDRRAFDPAAPWSAAPGPPPELETEKARLHEIEKLLRP